MNSAADRPRTAVIDDDSETPRDSNILAETRRVRIFETAAEGNTPDRMPIAAVNAPTQNDDMDVRTNVRTLFGLHPSTRCGRHCRPSYRRNFHARPDDWAGSGR